MSSGDACENCFQFTRVGGEVEPRPIPGFKGYVQRIGIRGMSRIFAGEYEAVFSGDVKTTLLLVTMRLPVATTADFLVSYRSRHGPSQ